MRYDIVVLGQCPECGDDNVFDNWFRPVCATPSCPLFVEVLHWKRPIEQFFDGSFDIMSDDFDGVLFDSGKCIPVRVFDRLPEG